MPASRPPWPRGPARRRFSCDSPRPSLPPDSVAASHGRPSEVQTNGSHGRRTSRAEGSGANRGRVVLYGRPLPRLHAPAPGTAGFLLRAARYLRLVPGRGHPLGLTAPGDLLLGAGPHAQSPPAAVRTGRRYPLGVLRPRGRAILLHRPAAPPAAAPDRESR